MHGWKDAAGDLVLGLHCPGCARPGPGLCLVCDRRLVPEPEEFWPGLWASGRWGGRLRNTVLAWKLSHVASLDARLAWFLAAAVIAADPEGDFVLVPVPSTRRSRRERGLDLVASLAVKSSELLADVGVRAPCRRSLVLRRQTRDQSRLDARGRSRNLRRAMTADIPAGTRCVVVDDIATTGATIGEASRALSEAGAVVIAAVTIAAVSVESTNP